MALAIKVVYENGVFRPLEPIDLPEGQAGTVMIDKRAQRREAMRTILSDMSVRWANPLDDSDAWVEDMAEEIDKAFQGEPSLSQIIIEDRGDA